MRVLLFLFPQQHLSLIKFQFLVLRARKDLEDPKDDQEEQDFQVKKDFQDDMEYLEERGCQEIVVLMDSQEVALWKVLICSEISNFLGALISRSVHKDT